MSWALAEEAVARAEALRRTDPEAAWNLVAPVLSTPGLPGGLEEQACAVAAMALLHLGDQDRAEIMARRGLALRLDKGNLKGRLLASLGISLHQRGRFVEAHRVLGRALTLACRSRDDEAVARALANIGISRSEAGRYREARSRFKEALALADARAGEPVFDSLALQLHANLGSAMIGLGNAHEGLAEIEDSLEKARKGNDALTLCYSLSEKGRALGSMGRSHEAREPLLESLTIAMTSGMTIVGTRSAALLAEDFLDEGDLVSAEHLLEQWLPQAAAGDSLRHAELLRLRGRLLALRGRFQEAYHESERAALMDRTGGTAAAAAASMDQTHGRLRKRARLLSERIEGWSEAVTRSLAILIDSRDATTGDHLDRSAAIVRILGELLIARKCYPHFGRQQLEMLARLAPLHDLGKVAVPDDILRKPGPLDLEERLVMQRHAIVGREVFLDAAKATRFDPLAAVAAEIAGSHHERWDGSGYPEGLAGEAIPIPARIVAVADVYDAIRSERPYKGGKSHAEAFDYVSENAGQHFDPFVVGAFKSCEERIAALYTVRGGH